MKRLIKDIEKQITRVGKAGSTVLAGKVAPGLFILHPSVFIV